jgi:hypothetical protein
MRHMHFQHTILVHIIASGETLSEVAFIDHIFLQNEKLYLITP